MPESKTNNVIEGDFSTNTINPQEYNNKKGNNFGGGNMEDYVTHRELRSELEKQDLKVKNQFTETNSRINELETKMDAGFKNIGTKLDDYLSKLVWWLMGIVSAGIIVPFVSGIIKFLFFK